MFAANEGSNKIAIPHAAPTTKDTRLRCAMRNDVPNPRVEKTNDATTIMLVDRGKATRRIML